MSDLLTHEEYKAIAADLSLPLNAYINGKFGTPKAGKTIMLRAIADLDPNEGQIELEGERHVWAAAHGDINLITVLLAGSAPGLEARDIGGNWHAVPCDPGMIAINVGDMLEMASGGYFPSTVHRVVNPEKAASGARFSMPMFLHPRPEVVLKEGVTAADFLEERLREIGLKG